MTATYWIKLYHEVLYDPKMARMNSDMWRRTVELFLLAGETDEDGLLPALEDMSWKLRLDPEQLETELIELQRLGIIGMVEGRYVVTKFAIRQAANSPAERMRMSRARNKREQYYGYEPVTSRNTEEIREDRDIDKIRGEEERRVQILLETIVGLPAVPADLPGIDELEHMDIQDNDIRGALQWRMDNSLGPVKKLSQLFPGIKTEYSKRVQNGNARKNGKQPQQNTARRMLEEMKARGEA
jgi:hypothetical protein